MKRKNNSNIITITKKHKPNEFDPNDYNYKIDNTWVPISKTRNGSLKDYCLDWFDMYNIKDINDKPIKEAEKKYTSKTKDDSFLSFILSKGNEFEQKIIEILKNKFSNDFI